MQKLAKKFIEVMKECSHIAKAGTNSFHGYKYATSADVMDRVNSSLAKHGIASAARPELLSLQDVTTVKGNTEHLATVKMTIELTDVDSGESCSITGLGSGQDAGDKAVMKAQTAAIKYAYMLSLAVSTGDDPEADIHTDQAGEELSVVPLKPKPIRKRVSQNNATVCVDCGTPISDKVFDFSVKRFGAALCMDCQKNHQAV
ncbi:ERF family protein [Schwartzia succinivorans]|jgi:hypothetical protein|uniref:ERF superfamily protein n=1 Tax=Schwartzia succinivorans DSM 10502 TaxID=1123243 RepID=A0A1M4UJ66_9FIRM|nr:ERF family protein [Schwartzia succinivorans]SHE56600.1 ERF superfamily protein [Schwartzia succinivorans DSM 10502]